MWIYEQGTGRISRNNSMLCIGYSGAGDGKNNPAMQNIPDVGPCPQGAYRIEPPRDTVEHGDFVLPLIPQPANEMYGRAGFLIHGDSVKHPDEASKGCIIAPRYARERIWESGDLELRVVEAIPPDANAEWPNGD